MKRLVLSQKLVNFDGSEFRDTLKDLLLQYFQSVGAQQLLPSLVDKGMAYELWQEIGRANGEIVLKPTQYDLLKRVVDGAGNLGSWSLIATQQVKQMVDKAEEFADVSAT